MSTGIYLFCLTPKDPHLQVAGIGVDGVHPLFVLESFGAFAVLSEVALEEFGGKESRGKLDDLTWVAPRLARHEEVIQSVMRQAPILPVRFGSVFSSIHELSISLKNHRESLAEFFVNTTGQKEWAIKAYADMAKVRSEILAVRMAAGKARLAVPSTGLPYFQEKKIKVEVERSVVSWLKERANDILVTVGEVSSTIRECQLLAPEAIGRGDDMFFHAALLVPDRLVGRLQGVATEWNNDHEVSGLRFESSGPLPPYHFTPVLDAQG